MGPVAAGYESGSKESGGGLKKSEDYDVVPGICVAAVVKVPLPVGCVKYKAQHVVLIARIPVLMRD
jgi:hypothetical protein